MASKPVIGPGYVYGFWCFGTFALDRGGIAKENLGRPWLTGERRRYCRKIAELKATKFRIPLSFQPGRIDVFVLKNFCNMFPHRSKFIRFKIKWYLTPKLLDMP